MNFLKTILLILLGTVIMFAQDSTMTTKSKTFVFVHGAWGGGWDYKHMEELIEAHGHKVYRPTLTGQGEREHLNGPNVNLDTHITDIVNVIKFEDLHDIILIGHSYGGMVITGVADSIPERISHIVYADAMLPQNGESVFDIWGDGEKFFSDLAKSYGKDYAIPPFWPDWGKDVPQPYGTFKHPISLTNQEEALKIPATYILTIDPGKDTDDFSKFAERAKERGWEYYEFQTGHNLQRTIPDEYAELLLKIAAEK